jgi:uncharacterized spore protein YtfJ
MMAKSEPRPAAQQTVDKELLGDPVTVGAWTVIPEARLSGSQGSGGDDVNGGGGARLRLDPVAVTVRDADGTTRRIEIRDTTAQAVQAMARAGLFIALLSLALQLWAGKRRKSDR